MQATNAVHKAETGFHAERAPIIPGALILRTTQAIIARIVHRHTGAIYAQPILGAGIGWIDAVRIVGGPLGARGAGDATLAWVVGIHIIGIPTLPIHQTASLGNGRLTGTVSKVGNRLTVEAGTSIRIPGAQPSAADIIHGAQCVVVAAGAVIIRPRVTTDADETRRLFGHLSHVVTHPVYETALRLDRVGTSANAIAEIISTVQPVRTAIHVAGAHATAATADDALIHLSAWVRIITRRVQCDLPHTLMEQLVAFALGARAIKISAIII